ncbi:MAG: NTP transferase domain-containing protein [Muribaculaceae bacterium]|nr:NTP transferase domain-containing protein [Muribaculaceae bacterium]
MNALVFAAGLGTRLKPWTLEHPKALVEVGGEPMLGRVLRRIASSGVAERVVVNVHHFAEQVKKYLASEDFGIEVIVSDESSLLLDTGGGMARAIELLGGAGVPLLVHNADILTDFPLEEMLSSHIDSEADATLLVAERASSRQLLIDASGQMRGWENLTSGEVLPAGLDTRGLVARAFGGVHVVGERMQAALLERWEASGRGAFGVMPFYIESCTQFSIRGYEPSTPYSWHDIGSPEKLAAAEKDFKRQK